MEENNNNNGCDQFTRPEEILELQKYLRAIKEELAERTELGTDVIQMDPSYRVGNIDLDRNLSSTGRIATNMNSESERIDFSNAILGVPIEGFPDEVGLGKELETINREGQKTIDKLPDTKDTINVERIERLEKVREKLLGADTNSPRELETYVEKLDVTPEKIDLGNELIKVTGESKEINLSQERIDLVEPKFIDSLGNDKEKMSGEIPELTLGEGSERIPFLETKINELSNHKESIESDQRSNQEEISLNRNYSSLPNDQGEMFGSDEELPDAVLSIPGELNETGLGNTKINLPNEGENKELSLSNFLDTIKGENNEPTQLRRGLEKEGHIPSGLQEINELSKELSKEGKLNGDSNIPNSLDNFISDQGIVPGNINDIDNLQSQLPEDSYIEGELKNPNLSKELPEDSYIEGELKNPNLSKELSEDGYIEGELKNPNLPKELSEDGYIEGELKNPNLSKELSEDNLIKGESETIDELLTDLPKNGHTQGEFEEIDELRTDLPKKDGFISGEFEDIDKLANKLPKKDGKVRGEFEDIDRLANKLPKKDGKVRGEFEKIDKLSRKLPKKDGYTRGDFKKIKELTEELPYPDGYPDGDFKEVKKLTKKLPTDGYVDGKFIELEELTEDLPEGGLVDGDFKKLPEELTKELPEEGTIDKEDLVKIKSLPEELSPDGKIDEEDLVEIKRLPEDLSTDGKIKGDLYEVERLTKKLPKDGKTDGNFIEIDCLNKSLPEGGKIEGKSKTINELPNEFEDEGLIQGDFKKLGDLSKEIPLGGLIDGDFKKPTPSNELPKDGKLNEEDLIKIKKLPKELPDDGHIGEEGIIEFQKLPKELPDDGHIGEEGIVKIKKLPEELPDDGHIGEEGIIEFQKLPSELAQDGHIGKEGVVEFQKLPNELTQDGIAGGDRKEISELDSIISDDGYIEGEFKTPDLVDTLSSDEYIQGNFVDISELDKALSNEGLIHGGETENFEENIITEEVFQHYSDSNNNIFSITGGTLPESTIPEKDNKKHVSPEELYNIYSGKSGGINIDPTTREVNHSGVFQISDGVIARDTFSSSDPSGEYNLYARRHPLELDDSEFNEIGGLIPKSSIPEGDNWIHRNGNQLDNKKFDEIGGLIPDSSIPESDNWEHRDIDHIDRSFDKVNEEGLVPDSTLPTGDDWKHEDPIDKMNFYNKSKVHEKSVDPKTKEREYKGEFSIEEGIVPDSEIPRGDIWEHEDFEKQFDLYSNSAVRIDSVDAEGNIKYKGEFKFDEGIVPENSRPKNEPDPKLYEWLRSLEKIDSGAGDLYHALLKRAGHDLDGYYKYLVHYAENKDLSSGWGQKLASALSEMAGSNGDSINLSVYQNFEDKLYTGVLDYYNHEGKQEIKLGQSHLPRGLDAYMSASGYLRYMADLVRSGYNLLESDKKTGNFWSNVQGVLGVKEIMLDRILMELVKLRDKGERETKSNRDRLPGGTSIFQEMLMDMDVWKAATTLGRTFLDKFRSNRKGSTHGDTTNPINRPVVNEISYDPDWDLNHSYDNFGNYTNTVGWYDPHAVKGKNSLPWWDSVKSAVKDTFTKSGNEEINYKFSDNYLQGSGIRLTLYDLAEHDLDNPNENFYVESVEDFMNVIRWSPLITEPSKFLLLNDPNSNRHITTTLDTNNYWEVVIEPYLGLDNGYCSYLPCVDEINIMNSYTHGVKTFYTRWIPVVSFDLSRSRTTTKSIGLFGGEFTIPGGIEYSNELRITILDDVFKSWRRYFEKCADVGVYNSRIHDREFYGYYDEGNSVKLSLDNWSIYRDITKEDLEKVTMVDKNAFALAPYKNVTFRIRIYIMTPQYSTINKYDLLATLKEVSVERAGEIDPGSQDLEISFSIVGETNEDYLSLKCLDDTSGIAANRWKSESAWKTWNKNKDTEYSNSKSSSEKQGGKGDKSSKATDKKSNKATSKTY